MAPNQAPHILRHLSRPLTRHVSLPHSSTFSAAAASNAEKQPGKKVVKPAQSGKTGSAERPVDRIGKLINLALTRIKVKPLDITPEQQLIDSAFAKKYSSLKMKEHREFQKNESGRLKAKLAAIAALPPGNLRDAAMQPDWTPFPSHRILPTESPPMKELLEERERESASVVTIKKSR